MSQKLGNLRPQRPLCVMGREEPEPPGGPKPPRSGRPRHDRPAGRHPRNGRGRGGEGLLPWANFGAQERAPASPRAAHRRAPRNSTPASTPCGSSTDHATSPAACSDPLAPTRFRTRTRNTGPPGRRCRRHLANDAPGVGAVVGGVEGHWATVVTVCAGAECGAAALMIGETLVRMPAD